jgi:apolipoprotein N-acyltransferase
LLSFAVRQIHPSAWLLIVLSAILQILIFPLPGVFVLSWFALAPLILALLRARPAGELEVAGSVRLQPASPAQAFLLSYVCGILWYAGTCYWIYDTMHQYGGLSAPAAVLVLFLFCCYLGLYHGLFGLLVSVMTRGSRDYRHALVAAPFVWVAVELARTLVTGFPWNLLGTAQVDNTALCRIATWTGVYGISFEIVLVNVAVAAAFLVPRGKRGAMLTAALAAAAVLQAGQLIDAPPSHADHAALLVQQNIPVSVNWTLPAIFQQTLHDLTELSVKSATTQGATTQTPIKIDLIVWPESPAPFFTNDTRFRDAVSQMARDTKAWAITGVIGTAPVPEGTTTSQMFNSAELVAPSGEWTARYDKIHLVPFGEYLPFPSLFAFAGGLTKAVGEFEHGVSRKPFDAGGTRIGVFICYESVFPGEVREFADQGAQVLVNISNDGWYGDSGAYAQHLNQTRMRAIENDRWLLSATDTGVTASIDPLGRVAAQIPRKQQTTLTAPYALTLVTTFYSRHGDWFAYACAIISLGALLMRFTFFKDRKKADASS